MFKIYFLKERKREGTGSFNLAQQNYISKRKKDQNPSKDHKQEDWLFLEYGNYIILRKIMKLRK